MKLSQAWRFLYIVSLTQACLTDEELAHELGVARRQTGNTGIPVGTGDRFEGGASFPRGVGTLESGTNLTTLLNVNEIESGLLGLANEYGFETFTSPYTTYENRSLLLGKVGGKGGCNDAYRVFLNGNIHARERGSADNVLYFIADLLYANKHKIGLTYGGRQYSYCDVQRALSTGIVFLPLSNPDGVAWDQSTNSCWRKNRNATNAVAGNANSIGIDLNRNFDFLWDFTHQFTPSVAPNLASTNPTSSTYHGGSPFSEAEARSIKWVMDTYSKVRWFLDLHSYAGVVLYSWGSDENQSRKPYMNFLNSSYDGARGLMPDSPSEGLVYGEYTSSTDWSENVFAAMRVGNAMDASTGRHYEVEQAAYLYPTSGASDDYSYSRHFADPSLNKVHGFTIEFGFGNSEATCAFYPTVDQYRLNMLETSSAFMEFLLSAQEIGLGDPVSCLT